MQRINIKLHKTDGVNSIKLMGYNTCEFLGDYIIVIKSVYEGILMDNTIQT